MSHIRQFVTSVGITATPIDGTQFPGWRLLNNGAAVVYIGGDTVAVTDGWPVAAAAIYTPSELAMKSLTGKLDNRLRGIVATGTVEVRVIVDGRTNV